VALLALTHGYARAIPEALGGLGLLVVVVPGQGRRWPDRGRRDEKGKKKRRKKKVDMMTAYVHELTCRGKVEPRGYPCAPQGL